MKDNYAGYLFHQGTNFETYEYLGSHLINKDGIDGAIFRVWCPNVNSVSVVGDFNGWNMNKHRMEAIDDEGVWEIFIEGVKEYDIYKYAITLNNGVVLYKADPYAFHSETPSNNASKVYNINGYDWGDEEYFKELYKNTNSLVKPISIYEINLASWKRYDDGNYYSYLALIDTLIPYVKQMGFTHVEFMPVSEYPFDGSWGYQVTGYYSVSSRFGTPKDFMKLVDEFHKNGIGVIIDWVPAHFPKDEFGLSNFNGGPLYENPRKDRQENRGWGTKIFDYGRTEIQSFLVSNAVFYFKNYHIDGIRVDAVASMLYLDYDRGPGEWTPNDFGNNKNLEAIAFLRKLNKEVFGRFPYALMMAEESSADVKITGMIEEGGLGFNYKWNMGWMNDTLKYMKTDPIFRMYEHNKLTFSLTYAFSENFILPISHDEVVHGKGSLINKMPGSYEDKFANNRVFLGYMMSHPGKKLTFMGEEIGQFKEWDYRSGIEFFLLDFPLHSKLNRLYRDINLFYRYNDAMYSIDTSFDGFSWLDVNNGRENVVSYMRTGLSGQKIVCMCNFSGNDLYEYKVRVEKGKYKVVLTSDDDVYGGTNRVYKGEINSYEVNGGDEICLLLPRLSFIYLEKI